MPRFVDSTYRRNIALLMAVYIALLLVLWPLIKSTSVLALKAVFTLLPVVPMIAVLWLIARRVMDSDELQQRVHLIALSAATGVVSAVSLAVGFLCGDARHRSRRRRAGMGHARPGACLCGYALDHRTALRRIGLLVTPAAA